MKKLIVFLLVILAAWYGWKKWPEIAAKRPGHDLVLINESGQPVERVRVIVGGQVLVKESLADGEKATLPFKIQSDSDFQLEADWVNKAGSITWRGGHVPAGPMLQRHILRIDAEGQIIYLTENK